MFVSFGWRSAVGNEFVSGGEFDETKELDGFLVNATTEVMKFYRVEKYCVANFKIMLERENIVRPRCMEDQTRNSKLAAVCDKDC